MRILPLILPPLMLLFTLAALSGCTATRANIAPPCLSDSECSALCLAQGGDLDTCTGL